MMRPLHRRLCSMTWPSAGSAFVYIWAVIGLAETGAQGRPADKPRQAGVADTEHKHITELLHRFDSLYLKLQEARNRYKSEEDARNSLNRRLKASSGREREDLEVEMVFQEDRLLTRYEEWEEVFLTAERLEQRVSKLKELGDLRSEIGRLEVGMKKKSDEIQAIESNWRSKRAECKRTAQPALPRRVICRAGPLSPTQEPAHGTHHGSQSRPHLAATPSTSEVEWAVGRRVLLA